VTSRDAATVSSSADCGFVVLRRRGGGEEGRSTDLEAKRRSRSWARAVAALRLDWTWARRKVVRALEIHTQSEDMAQGRVGNEMG
jgi:hypothetical protein